MVYATVLLYPPFSSLVREREKNMLWALCDNGLEVMRAHMDFSREDSKWCTQVL